MTILALMQNQWLKDAAYHQRRFDAMRAEDIAKWRKVWRRTVAMALFAGCHSGRVLKKHLGELTGEIIWEESTRIITAKPSDCPPADLAHVRETLEDVQPDVVITFGLTARQALNAVMAAEKIPYAFNTINSPHPAARGAGQQESVREACVALLNRVGRY